MDEIHALLATRQRARDVSFLLMLGIVLLALAQAVIRAAYPPRSNSLTASGEIRAVDPATLRRLLGTGRISNHEARHWRRVGAGETAPVRHLPPAGGRK